MCNYSVALQSQFNGNSKQAQDEVKQRAHAEADLKRRARAATDATEKAKLIALAEEQAYGANREPMGAKRSQ